VLERHRARLTYPRNINLFGLVFIIVIACTFVTTDLLLLKALVHLSKFRKALAPRLDRWVQDGTLQLQRRAFEAEGQGTWENFDSEVPVTSRGEKLNQLSGSPALYTIDISEPRTSTEEYKVPVKAQKKQEVQGTPPMVWDALEKLGGQVHIDDISTIQE